MHQGEEGGNGIAVVVGVRIDSVAEGRNGRLACGDCSAAAGDDDRLVVVVGEQSVDDRSSLERNLQINLSKILNSAKGDVLGGAGFAGGGPAGMAISSSSSSSESSSESSESGGGPAGISMSSSSSSSSSESTNPSSVMLTTTDWSNAP